MQLRNFLAKDEQDETDIAVNKIMIKEEND